MNDPSNRAEGVIAVGASAGGVQALMQFAAGLSPELPYAVMIVLHMRPEAPSALAKIIDRSGPLPAVTAHNGGELTAGRIYVGTPGRHLLALDHTTVLAMGPTENGHRPSINALFRSVALAFGSRAVGVLLSGVLDDGVLGLGAIRSRGGVTVCQQPGDALFPAMPTNAFEAGVVDHRVSAGEMGTLIDDLVARESEELQMEANVGSGAVQRRYLSAAGEAENALSVIGGRLGLTNSEGGGS